MITQERLKELLKYNPDTGIFIWIKSVGTVRSGAEAGCINDNGYLLIQIDGRRYRGHRLCFLYMTGSFPVADVDHLNHVRDDNRWANIREATAQDNAKNRVIASHNKSGFIGVYFCADRDAWRSQICVNRKKKHLGYFKQKSDAVKARHIAERHYNFHENHGKEKQMIAPPFNVWLSTNLADRIMVLKYSPNGKQELQDFLDGGRRDFNDYEFYLTIEEVNLAVYQPSKYLETYSADITTWERL